MVHAGKNIAGTVKDNVLRDKLIKSPECLGSITAYHIEKAVKRNCKEKDAAN